MQIMRALVPIVSVGMLLLTEAKGFPQDTQRARRNCSQLVLKLHFHRVGPIGCAVGDQEPDWAKAPNKGDQLKDGTCVWENTGQLEGLCLKHELPRIPPLPPPSL